MGVGSGGESGGGVFGKAIMCFKGMMLVGRGDVSGVGVSTAMYLD